MKLFAVLTAVLLLSFSACDPNGRGPDPCGDGEISAADAVWSHGEGDLQNTKRAPNLRTKGCVTAPDSAPQLVWSFDIGGGGTYAAPVIGDDGTIYIEGEYPGEPIGGGIKRAGLLAINSTGTLKWFFEKPVDLGTGIAAAYNHSVAIDQQGRLYGNFKDTLYCLNQTGDIRWLYPVPRSSSPALDNDGNVLIGGDTVLCFSNDGIVRWRLDITETTERCLRVVPGKKAVYCQYQDYGIIAIGYDGQKRWSRTPISISFHGTILVDEEENIYFRVDQSTLASVDRFGQLRWSLGTSPPGFGTSEPVLRGDRIYSATLGNLFSTDKETGGNSQLLGGVPRPIAIDSSPLIADDGKIIVATQYEGTSPPLLACIGQDSTIRWQVPIPGAEYTDFQGYLALSQNGEIILATFSIESSAVNRVYKFK